MNHTKQIKVDCHVIRQHITQDTIIFYLISSSDQSTDIFTKFHPPDRFHNLVSKLKLAFTKSS